MFVRGDRSRRHRTLAATKGRMLAQVSSSHSRSGPVRSELTNINLAEARGAVSGREQLRSRLTNKTTPSDIGTANGVNEARFGSLTPTIVPLSLRGRVLGGELPRHPDLVQMTVGILHPVCYRRRGLPT
jgi:hypothetical protein